MNRNERTRVPSFSIQRHSYLRHNVQLRVSSSLDDLFAYCICSVVLSDSLFMQFVAQVDSVQTNSDGSIFQTEFSIRNSSFYISQVLKALSKN